MQVTDELIDEFEKEPVQVQTLVGKLSISLEKSIKCKLKGKPKYTRVIILKFNWKFGRELGCLAYNTFNVR